MICHWRAHQLFAEAEGCTKQKIDLLDTDISRHFGTTKFNNGFIIRSPSLFSYFNHFLAAQGSDLAFFSRERGSHYA